MCEYCGCDGIPAVAELIAEHDAIRDLARVARQAATADDRPGAVVAVGRIMELLGPHTQIEEQGLFAAMVGEFGGYISSLIGEHIALDAAFAEFGMDQPAPGWQQRLIAALDHLFEHILREQDGLFPAALAALTPAEWDVVDVVRAAVGGDVRPSHSSVR